MTLEMVFVAAMIALMLISLLFEVARADFLVFLFLVIFLLSGVISTEQALSGFSNEGMLTVLLLFIVAGAIQKHGIIENFIYRILGETKSMRGSMVKLLPPISLVSAFLNNTPIVVTLTPILRNWARNNGYAPSKILIPLSYATILGGTITLIGTSTNLIVHGLLINAGVEGFSFFTLSIVGVPIAIVGLIYILTIGYKILPDNLGAEDTIRKEAKEFLAEATIQDSFEHINETILAASKNSFEGVYIIEIIREDGERVEPVEASTYIRKGDHIIFSASLNRIAVIEKLKGISLETGTDKSLDVLQNENHHLVEAVISHNSSLVGKTIRDSEFRSTHEAGVIAVHRNNQRINSRVGDIILRPGDTLLLLADDEFVQRHQHSQDFYVVYTVNPPEQLKQNNLKGFLALGLLLVMILSVTLGFLSMFEAMLIAVILLVVTRLINWREILDYIQFDVLLLIASAFAIGAAMTESGLAQFLAENMLVLAQPLGIIGVVFIIYIATNIFTELITNSAAAVLMFPIAFEMADQLNVDYMGFIVTIAVAASCSFITPIGYQTNLIVYGPGGYKFSDYIKIGAPLVLLTMVTTSTIVYLVWF
ncbi:SLC13 family permease [Salinicoccus halitifaciens]|uniref:Di/tricarboxylate transporter n=1 Tax=Salinicoccus halitifaciens TaxID=1073415 RepID=A0ABV2EAJ1_9STAP|nr:SLC13 family permease [Salinicoccus halitifaciens]MCD2138549.1 SLC13 family permease [Salinicoccus halitifaciens]